MQWTEIESAAPDYSFKQKNRLLGEFYNKNFSIDSLYVLNATGIKTERDVFAINFKKSSIENIKEDLINLDATEIRAKYKLDKDGRDWTLRTAQEDIRNNISHITQIEYRPFDKRYTIYSGKTKGFMAYPREKIMGHMFAPNYCLISTRLNRGLSSGYNFISNIISDLHLLDSAADSLQAFPLYLYQQPTELDPRERIPNFNPEIIKEIAAKLGLEFVAEKEPEGNVCLANSSEVRDEYKSSFEPIDLLDYIYAVLHSPTYRETYKEFLKIDFPRVPFPKPETFWQLVQLGSEIRQLHLLEGISNKDLTTRFSGKGENVVEKPVFVASRASATGPEPNGEPMPSGPEALEELEVTGSVYINATQYFENIPKSAWNFYIGGYQPAQKWLKDRKGRTLDFEDVLHYQKMIYAMMNTERLMKEIDEVRYTDPSPDA